MKKALFAQLPKVDELLESAEIKKLLEDVSRPVVVDSIRESIDQVRKNIVALTPEEAADFNVNKQSIIQSVLELSCAKEAFHLRRVVNATGVVLHTNLGRSLIAKELNDHLGDIASHYSTLEFDTDNGKRGSRYSHVEDIICELTGAEAALVVNNNAAAVMLVLSTLSEGKEAVVSRGQLVEIGGSFRIPEVMRFSGAKLVEIGTTNKTHLRDYEKAITEDTGVLLKVHTSNYRIMGFTQEVSVEELAPLANAHGIPLVEDIGSGSLIDFSRYGLSKEPTVQEAIAAGADVVTFSGDKMLGGPQAGIIVGKKQYIEEMKANHLTRALRVDKMTLCVLEGTLKLYRDEDRATQMIPSLKMLTMQAEDIKPKADCLRDMISQQAKSFNVEIVKGASEVGGGSMPLEKLPTYLVSVTHDKLSANKIINGLREYQMPVIARVEDDNVLFDPRTIMESEFEYVAKALSSLE